MPDQIGCKSIEVMTTKFDWAGIQCNLNDLHPIQIQPDINYWSNWVEIHSDYTII